MSLRFVGTWITSPLSARHELASDLPGFGGSRHQHVARRGAGSAERFPEGSHRGRAAGHLKTQEGIAVEFVIRGCMFDVDLFQLHFQFFGNEHGHRSIGALAHLDLGNDQRYLPATIDTDKGAGSKSVCVVGLRVADQLRHGHAQQQTSAGGDTSS